MLNITPWTEEKFPEIVQSIYNAIFINVCQIYVKRTKTPGEISTMINDLNHKDSQQNRSCSTWPKESYISQIKDYKSSWQHVQPQVNNQKVDILQEEK